MHWKDPFFAGGVVALIATALGYPAWYTLYLRTATTATATCLTPIVHIYDGIGSAAAIPDPYRRADAMIQAAQPFERESAVCRAIGEKLLR